MVFSNNMLLGVSAQTAEFLLANSVLLNGTDEYFTRTPSTTGNRKTWTWDGWVKLGNISLNVCLFSAGVSVSDDVQITINGNDKLDVICRISSSNVVRYTSTQVFRDTTAWQHFAVQFDSTQASGQVRAWHNGVEITAWDTSTDGTQNQDYDVNSTDAHYIGKRTSGSNYLDGRIAFPRLIDGAAVTPEGNLIETDEEGYKKPKSYAVTGTNRFVLNFSDSADLGNDVSGAGNDWTPTNIAAANQTSDSPTDSSADGHGNFALFNPLLPTTLGTLSLGNTQYVRSGNHSIMRLDKAIPSTGKWYFVVENVAGTIMQAGIVREGSSIAANIEVTAATGGIGSQAYATTNGIKRQTTNVANNQALWNSAGNQCIVVADVENDLAWFGVSSGGDWYWNGNASADPSTDTGGVSISLTTYSGELFFAISVENATIKLVNDPSDFTHAAPSGCNPIATQNFSAATIPDPSAHFNTVLYTGNGSTQSITSVGHQPDFVWIKNRDAADSHVLTDAVRGATEILSSDATTAETTDADTLTSFDSDGFSLGADVKVNTNTENYVAWCWKANGSGSTNTDGTITSTVSANTTAGFSIATWTGNGTTTGQTVGTGLTSVDFAIAKNRTDASSGWSVHHKDLTAGNHLFLMSTAAQAAISASNGGGIDITSGNLLSLVQGSSTIDNVNKNSSNYVAYCWEEIEGFSKFGSYTGNGSTDGPFVYCGFRPAFILIKRTDSTGEWILNDIKRDTYNVADTVLNPHLSNAESTATMFDILSTGFKLRASNTNRNASGGTFIFAAFAEQPFQGGTSESTQARAR